MMCVYVVMKRAAEADLVVVNDPHLDDGGPV